MTEIYIAGHGNYAKGIISALTMLLGDKHGVIPICAYGDEIVSIHQLESYLTNISTNAVKNGNDIVLFTDIPGGSVNNIALKISAANLHMHLICGVSLVMIMDFLLSEEKDTTERIVQACHTARESMYYINQTKDFIMLHQAIVAQNKMIQERLC